MMTLVSHLLLITASFFHEASTDSSGIFKFYASQSEVTVPNTTPKSASFQFIIENPHGSPHHHLEASVTIYGKNDVEIETTPLPLSNMLDEQPLKMEYMTRTGFTCSRWVNAIQNQTIVEYACRATRNEATRNVTKMVFKMTYIHLDERMRTQYYKDSVVVNFERGISTAPLQIIRKESAKPTTDAITTDTITNATITTVTTGNSASSPHTRYTAVGCFFLTGLVTLFR